MNRELAAQGFAAMGSETRLQVIKALIRSGTQGLTVGELQKRTAMPASTLAHHLKFLSATNLVKQERHGRSTYNLADFEQLQALADFILHECCIEEHCSGEQ